MSKQYAKFQMEGTISRTAIKQSKKTGNDYGRITVATGEAGHDFFVEPRDIHNGTYAPGVCVKVTGDIGRDGYNASLENDIIEIVAPEKAKA